MDPVMRTLAASALGAIIALLGVSPAVAKTRVAATGATVTFPEGVIKHNVGPQSGRHGDPVVMMLLFTVQKTRGTDEDLAALGAAVKSVETWSVMRRESGDVFLFSTMAFPNNLATSLWGRDCNPPAEMKGSGCRVIELGGATGREYVTRWPDPTRPGEKSYSVMRFVVREDRLYLLSYLGAEVAALLPSETPSTPAQDAFFQSLRFQDP